MDETGSRKLNILIKFELPNKVIHIGDTWTLDNISFTGNNNQNFICAEARKENIITLTSIKVIEGDTIAVIDYSIMEYISGVSVMPEIRGISKANSKKSSIQFVYKGRSEFSISMGKWISFNGLVALETTGYANSSQKFKYALIE